jgi:hypothetical protein
MLAQCAQSDKLVAAIRLGTPVDLALMAWALQVLVEGGECPEFRVAQEALVRVPVPREFRRPYRGRRMRLISTRPAEQSRGIRNEVMFVRANDQAVELCARHT